MRLPFTTLDVFTPARYIGNPVAVVRVAASLRSQLTEEQKQKIAREFNFSETTFLHELLRSPRAATSTSSPPHLVSHLQNLRTLAGTIPFTFEEESGESTVAIPHDVHVHHATLPQPNRSKHHRASRDHRERHGFWSLSHA
jgi:predicted PhzF superfamily epimerase YddE/YHI9